MHGNGTVPSMNGTRVAGQTDNDRYTVYASPFFSLTYDGRYVYHVYMSGERIATIISCMLSCFDDFNTSKKAGKGVTGASSAYETAGRAITFNAAGVSELTTHKSTLANIDAYITIGDELNAFQVFMPFMNVADGKKHWRYGRLLFGHSIENFISPPLILSNKK